MASKSLESILAQLKGKKKSTQVKHTEVQPHTATWTTATATTTCWYRRCNKFLITTDIINRPDRTAITSDNN